MLPGRRHLLVQTILFVLLAVNIEVFCQTQLILQGLETPSAPARRDPRRGWRLESGEAGRFRINQEGLRAEDLEPNRPPGEKRILCLGGSVTFGADVADRDAYPQQLQALLDPSARLKVINAGGPGYTTCEIIELLIEITPLYKPDVIVVQCGANDLPTRYGGMGIRPYREVDPEASDKIFGSHERVDSVRAFLYRLGTYRYLTCLLRPHEPASLAGMEQVAGIDDDETASFTLSVDNLKILDAFARQKGLRMLLVDEAHRTDWTGGEGFRNAAAYAAAMQRMRAAHAAVAERLGIPYLDMHAALHAAGIPDAELFQKGDILHLTPRGLGVVARLVRDRLGELGWIPRPPATSRLKL